MPDDDVDLKKNSMINVRILFRISILICFLFSIIFGLVNDKAEQASGNAERIE